LPSHFYFLLPHTGLNWDLSIWAPGSIELPGRLQLQRFRSSQLKVLPLHGQFSLHRLRQIKIRENDSDENTPDGLIFY
jgi:hypothetical protein